MSVYPTYGGQLPPKNPTGFLNRLNTSLDHAKTTYNYEWPYLVEMRDRWVLKAKRYEENKANLDLEAKRTSTVVLDNAVPVPEVAAMSDVEKVDLEELKTMNVGLMTQLIADHNSFSAPGACHGYKQQVVTYLRDIQIDSRDRVRLLPHKKPDSDKVDFWHIWLATHKPSTVLSGWKTMLERIVGHENLNRVAYHHEEGVLKLAKFLENAAIALQCYGKIAETHRLLFPRLDRFDLFHSHCTKCSDIIYTLASYQFASNARMVARMDALIQTEFPLLLDILDKNDKAAALAQKKIREAEEHRLASSAKNKMYALLRKEKGLKPGQKLNMNDEQRTRLHDAEYAHYSHYKGSHLTYVEDPDATNSFRCSEENQTMERNTRLAGLQKDFDAFLKKGTDKPAEIYPKSDERWNDWCGGNRCTPRLFQSYSTQKYRVERERNGGNPLWMFALEPLHTRDLHRYDTYWLNLSHYSEPKILVTKCYEKVVRYIDFIAQEQKIDPREVSITVKDLSKFKEDIILEECDPKNRSTPPRPLRNKEGEVVRVTHEFHFTVKERRHFDTQFGHIGEYDFKRYEKGGLFVMQEEGRVRKWREGDVYVRYGFFKTSAERAEQRKIERQQERETELEKEKEKEKKGSPPVELKEQPKEEEENEGEDSDDMPLAAVLERVKRPKVNIKEKEQVHVPQVTRKSSRLANTKQSPLQLFF